MTTDQLRKDFEGDVVRLDLEHTFPLATIGDYDTDFEFFEQDTEDAYSLFKAAAERYRPRWIPVGEQLPPNCRRVFILYRVNHKPVVTMGWYCRAGEIESSQFGDAEVDDFYDEEKDDYFLNEQWVSGCSESEFHYTIDDVIAWQPLPSTEGLEQG